MNDHRVDDATYQAYLDERKSTLVCESDQAASYDKWLITLASGAIGVSIAFFRFIAPNPDPSTLCLLVASWVSLAVSISATLLSFLASQKSYRQYRDDLDTEFECQRDGRTNDFKGFNQDWSVRVDRLNWGSLISFLIGVALLAAFCIANVHHGGVSDEQGTNAARPAAAKPAAGTPSP